MNNIHNIEERAKNKENWNLLSQTCSVEDITEYISSDENANIDNNCNIDFVIPKLYCNIKDKKFNLFDRFSYIQFIEFTLSSKLNSKQGWINKINNKNNNNKIKINSRNKVYYFVKNNLDLKIEKNKKFLVANEKVLRKLNNKRQLLMFLNKKFSKLHHLNDSIAYIDNNNNNNKSLTLNYNIKKILLNILFIIILTVVMLLCLIILLLKTDIFEYIFEKNPRFLFLIKTMKLTLFTILIN